VYIAGGLHQQPWQGCLPSLGRQEDEYDSSSDNRPERSIQTGHSARLKN